jgi:hypothetical protein
MAGGPEMIVKVQKPLSSTEEDPSYFVYGFLPRHPRYHPTFMRTLPAHVGQALATAPKAYFKATWSEIRGWNIGVQVPEQVW